MFFSTGSIRNKQAETDYTDCIEYIGILHSVNMTWMIKKSYRFNSLTQRSVSERILVHPWIFREMSQMIFTGAKTRIKRGVREDHRGGKRAVEETKINCCKITEERRGG